MGGVEAGEPLVWWADSDDPYYTLRHSGGPLVACFLVPAIVVVCAAGAHGPPGAGAFLPAALVPLAVIVAAWEFLLDRRAIVEIRLSEGELTLIRASRRVSRLPLAQLRRVEVVRNIRDGDPHSSRLWLHLGERVERTRHGPADLPDRWVTALNAAEVELQVRERHYSD